MKHHLFFTLPVAAFFTLLLTPAGFISAAKAEEAERAPILPDEDALRELGDLAGRLLKDFSDQVTPMIGQLKALMDDLDSYQAPEMLPNGDIIIRRKPEAPPLSPPPEENKAIDL